MCSKGVAKCILIVFNALFLLMGAVCLGAGLFVKMDKSMILDTLSRVPMGNNYNETIEEVMSNTSLLEDSAIALIVAGAVVFIISGLGFFGACKGSKPMLYAYAIIVLLIFCCEIAAGVLGYFYKDRLNTYFRNFLQDTITDYYNSGTFGTDGTNTIVENIEPVSAAWDFTMYNFQCCGNYNYTDFADHAKNWNNNVTYTENGVTQNVTALVPITCCKMASTSTFPTNIQFNNLTDCLTTASSDSTNHETCYQKLLDLFTQYAYICLGVGIGVALIEISGILAACCLVRAINKDKD